MPTSMRPGDVLAGRYRLVDLLSESKNGRFWRAFDTVLARHVAMHLIPVDDERAEELMNAARRSATLLDPHLLRVLDTDTVDGLCYVVNEWGEGDSLDHLLLQGPLDPRRAAWVVTEVGALLAQAHAAGLAHGRMVPENVLIDQAGSVKVIGFAVDAALHGLPSGRAATDVVDLAAVLYAALTGKWPGISTSIVAPAPQEHGRPLRPRQVRAGVPKMLDSLCDEVLSPVRGNQDHGYDSAKAIVDALCTWIGDTAAVAHEEVERHRNETNPRLPRIADQPSTAEMPVPAVEPEPEPAEDADADAAESEPERTQLGSPVFHDEVDEVDWLTPGKGPVVPPPPFEDPPERPLFAPDPPEGRVPRTPPLAPPEGPDGSGGTYWPWEDEPAAAPAFFERAESVPGRSWMRIAFILAACVLVLLAVAYAVNRGSDGDGLLGGDDPDGSGSPNANPTAVVPAAIQDFDPLGSPPEENGDEALRAIDGKADTVWPTQSYKQNLGPGGLKEGVGLLLDLGKAMPIGDVEITLVGAPTGVRLLGSEGDDPPTGLDDLDELATGTADETSLTLTPDDSPTARFLVVWLTSLPQGQGGFRGEIAEIVVRS